MMNQQAQSNQVRLNMSSQLIAAARLQGMEGVRVNAMLQEQIRLQQQGIDVDSERAKGLIRQAGAMAELSTKIKDAAQATEIRASGRDQLEAQRLETSLIGVDSVERERRMSIMQGEIQARALERQGMAESAAATRESATAIANETAVRQQRFSRMQAEQEAIREYNRVLQNNAQILKSQGRDPANAAMPLHTEGGTTRASDWPQAQSMSFSAPAGYAYQGGGGLFSQKRYYLVPTRETAQGWANERKATISQVSGISDQAMTRSISLAMTALDKQIADIQKRSSKASEETQKASETRQEAKSLIQSLESQIQQGEQRRQAEIQKYLSAGPSPTEQNADLFYDPKKRLLFAEQIAGNTNDALKIQLQQLQAQEAAAKAQEELAKAQEEAIKQEADAVQAQIEVLEGQRAQLESAQELLSAGVDLSKPELDAIVQLIGVVKNQLPNDIAVNFNRIFEGSLAADMKNVAQTLADSRDPYSPMTRQGAVAGTTEIASLTKLTSGTSSLRPYDPISEVWKIKTGVTPNPYIPQPMGLGGSFQHGGEFTVPGSYSAGDKPYAINLAGQERVTIETPDQQVARSKAVSAQPSERARTVIENLIVRLPATVDPITYMNKKSRPSLSRAVRGLARSM
jgi:hypothetical protein